MSFGARLTIAIVFMLVGAGCTYAAIDCGDRRACWVLWPSAFLCAVIVASCFPGRHSAVTNRIIGAVVFGVYLAYIVAEIKDRAWISWSRGTPSLLMALVGMWVWGVPGAYIMVHGHLWWNPFEKPRQLTEEELADLADDDDDDGGGFDLRER